MRPILLIIGLILPFVSHLTAEKNLHEKGNLSRNQKSEDGELAEILTCNFDTAAETACRPKFRTNGSTPSYSIVSTSSQTVGAYRITDVSSIKLPAANGEYCQIPYNDAGNEYYHCRTTGTDCMTTIGVFSKCASGQFHYAKPGARLEPYTVEFLFPTFDLRATGDFLARFYILMFCNREGCEEAYDFISFTVNDAENGNSTVVYKEFLLEDLEMEKKWIQVEVRFSVPSSRVNIAFHLGRRIVFGTSNILAFDQFELFEIVHDLSTTVVPVTSLHTTLESTTHPIVVTTTEKIFFSSTQPDNLISTTPIETSASSSSSTSVSTKITTTTTKDPISTTSGNGEHTVVKILGCSFDVNDPSCNLKYRTNGTVPSYSIIQTSSQLLGTYRITDFTSITAPTANGEVCQIPYNDAEVVYYHCRNAANECKTTISGVFSKCADGKFQYARPGAKLEPYTVEFLFPAINIEAPGYYLVKFHILMLCNKDGCDEAQDYIALSVNDASDRNSTIFYNEFKLNDLEMEKRWIQREVRFKITTDRIYLMFHLGRRVLFGTSNLLAFDQVEFYYLADSSSGTSEVQTTQYIKTTSESSIGSKTSSLPITGSTTAELVHQTTTVPIYSTDSVISTQHVSTTASPVSIMETFPVTTTTADQSTTVFISTDSITSETRVTTEDTPTTTTVELVDESTTVSIISTDSVTPTQQVATTDTPTSTKQTFTVTTTLDITTSTPLPKTTSSSNQPEPTSTVPTSSASTNTTTVTTTPARTISSTRSSLTTILVSVIAAAVVVIATIAVIVYMKMYKKGCFKQGQVHPDAEIEME